jgi:hypothetical protein
MESRDSSVGIAAGWTASVRFPAGASDFPLLHSLQTGSWSHPASYPVGTGDSLKVKRSGRDADHSPLSIAEVKNGGTIPPLPYMSSWYSCLIN